MPVNIKASGVLKQYIAPDAALEDVHTVGEALEQLALPELGELIMLVNNRPAYQQTELADGDTLYLLPGISGGSAASARNQEPSASRS